MELEQYLGLHRLTWGAESKEFPGLQPESPQVSVGDHGPQDSPQLTAKLQMKEYNG